MAKISERSYSGKFFRPKPEVHCEEDGSLTIIATPWGNRSGAQKVISTIKDFFLSAIEDNDNTSPFEVLTYLSPTANNLRVSVMLANDSLYLEDNRNEYSSGVELIVIAKSENEIAYTCIGMPHIFIDRKGFPPLPLATGMDLALDISHKGHLLPPLPNDILGLASTSNFSVHSARVQKGDRFIAISRTTLPATFYDLPHEQRQLNTIAEAFSKSDAESPFWIGLIDLGS